MRRARTQSSKVFNPRSATIGEPRAAPTKKTRRSQLTITGRLVPPGSSPPNPNHPLALLTPEERLDVALEALGNLILKVIEDEKEDLMRDEE